MAFERSDGFREEELAPVRGTPRWVLAVGAAIAMFVGCVIWLLSRGVDQEAIVAGPDSRPVAIATDGYVGSKSCRECHQHEYETWHESYHRTMTQVASRDSVLGDFDNVQLNHFGREYRLGRDQEKFWVEFDEFNLGEAASSAPPPRQNIVLCTGSHHMQVYWMPTGHGRELAVLPFAWLVREKKWVPRGSAFLEPPSADDEYEAGRWNHSCITCHTTHGDRKLDPPRPPQSTVAEFGISCEACHGPGEKHIAFHRNPNASLQSDPITQPSKLSHVRASEVCGRCHMAWHAEVAGSSLNFRPGDDLQRLRQVVKKPSQFWPDGMVRVVGREFNGLLGSPCFQNGELSCLNCHRMHQGADDNRPRADWIDDQLRPGMRGNQACITCHEEYRDEAKLTAHTHHLPASQGSLCYNCHMPNTSYGLLKSTRSHTISIPSVAETLEAGRPNGCNLCHLDKTLHWTGEQLSRWYGQSVAESDPLASPQEGDPQIALSIEMTLAGDAAQRALIAWHMGWDAAREASGSDWTPPYLAILMNDDYPAVRFIAQRSLQQTGGYEGIRYDAEMSPPERLDASRQITERWRAKRAVVDRPSLLIAPDGELDLATISKILQRRDQTIISLEE